MKMIKKVVTWTGTVFFGILIFSGGIASVLWLIATLNILPIEKWQKIKKEKLKIGTKSSIVIGIVLFILGVLALPNSETDKNPDKIEPKPETSVTTTVPLLDSEVKTTTPKVTATITEPKHTTTKTTSTPNQTVIEPITTTVNSTTTTKLPETTTVNSSTTKLFTTTPKVTTTTTKPKQTTTTTTTKTKTKTSKIVKTFDYVVNTNTGKFHEVWCSSVDRIVEDNRMDYHGTREELLSMGYEACKNCAP